MHFFAEAILPNQHLSAPRAGASSDDPTMVWLARLARFLRRFEALQAVGIPAAYFTIRVDAEKAHPASGRLKWSEHLTIPACPDNPRRGWWVGQLRLIDHGFRVVDFPLYFLDFYSERGAGFSQTIDLMAQHIQKVVFPELSLGQVRFLIEVLLETKVGLRSSY